MYFFRIIDNVVAVERVLVTVRGGGRGGVGGAVESLLIICDDDNNTFYSLEHRCSSSTLLHPSFSTFDISQLPGHEIYGSSVMTASASY